MTQMDLFQTQTQDEQSSQPDIHVSHFHFPGGAQAQKMTDISGRTYFPLFKPNDTLGAFSRMFMGMSLWASTKCYLTWKGKATPQGRSLFQLVPRTHPTEETEFGSLPEIWPTPDANMGARGTQPHWTKTRPSGHHAQYTLNQAVRDNSQMWPTPAARDYKGANGFERTKKKLENGERAQMGQLPNAVMMEEGKQISGSLNPQWVEWLMGYPEGWTDLED